MIACLLGLLVQTGDGEADNLLWPVGDGWKAPEVYTAYGQAVDQGAPVVHRGLDVLPPPDWRRVYAIESGTVIDVRRSDDGEAGVLIEGSKTFATGKKRAFLYLHLDPKQIRVKKHARVRENQWIGLIPADDGNLDREHLHLSRIEGDYASHAWSDLEDLSVRNPLVLIDSDHHEDSTAPKIHGLARGHFGFLHHDTDEELDSDNLPGGAIDIIARVDDESDRSKYLSPRSLHLTVKGGGAVTPFQVVFDSPLPDVGVYSEDPPFPSQGAHEMSGTIETPVYYFFLTGSSGWQATSGNFVLELTAADASGMKTTVKQPVHVN